MAADTIPCPPSYDMADTIPELPEAEVDLLVDILTQIGAKGSCEAGLICRSWGLVETVLKLQTRRLLIIADGELVLTRKGREWAEAFSFLAESKS